jgi:hypothetical protein
MCDATYFKVIRIILILKRKVFFRILKHNLTQIHLLEYITRNKAVFIFQPLILSFGLSLIEGQNVTSNILEAIPWLRQLVTSLSLQRLRFHPRLPYVGFVVDKVALEQVFLQLLQFSPVSNIPSILHDYSFICY